MLGITYLQYVNFYIQSFLHLQKNLCLYFVFVYIYFIYIFMIPTSICTTIMKNIYRSVNTLSLFLYYKFISIKIYLCTKSFYSLVLLSVSLSGYPQRVALIRSFESLKVCSKKILLVKYATQDWLYSFRLWIARAEQSFKSPSRLGSYLLPTGEKRMDVVLKMRIKGRKEAGKVHTDKFSHRPPHKTDLFIL